MNHFSEKFISLISKAMRERKLKPKKSFDIDCPVELTMNNEHLSCLRLLEPFGPGNSQPIFKDSSVSIVNSKAVGRDSEHLQVTIRGQYSNLKGIGFNLGDRVQDIQKRPKRNILYTPTMNRFRGTVNWQVRVIEI